MEINDLEITLSNGSVVKESTLNWVDSDAGKQIAVVCLEGSGNFDLLTRSKPQ